MAAGPASASILPASQSTGSGRNPSARITQEATVTTASSEPRNRSDSPPLILRTYAPAAGAGDTVRYTIQLANPGEQAVEGAVVSYDLPPGAILVSASRQGRRVGQRIIWPAIALLEPGALDAFSFEITMADGTVASVGGTTARGLAAVSTPPGTGSRAFDTDVSFAATPASAANRPNATRAAGVPAAAVSPSALPNLQIEKTGPATVLPQDTIVYRITFRNTENTVARQVVVTDVLPPGVTFIGASDGGIEAGGIVTWPTRPALSNDNAFTYQLRVRAPVCPATLVNAVTITSATADADPSDNSATAVTVVPGPPCTADVAVEKSGPASVFTGDTIVYTVRATNLGPVPAGDVVVTDALPSGVTFLDASGGITPVAGLLTWPATVLDPGRTISFVVRVRAPECPAAIENVARVRSANDARATNDVSRVATTVIGPACVPATDLGIRKTGPAMAMPDDTLTYTVSVWNDGPEPATGVVVTDTLPLAGRLVGASGGAAAAGGVLTWPSFPLAPGDTVSFEVRFEAPACASITNVAAVSLARPVDSVPSNNRSSVTTRIDSPACNGADVVIEKEAFPLFADRGERVEFTVRVWNAGPQTALDVEVLDTLPANHGFVSATGGAERSGNQLRWPLIPRLPVGDTLSWSIVVTIPGTYVGETYTNIARVKSASPVDPDVRNNRDTATVFLGTNPRFADLVPAKDTVGAFVAGRTARYRITVGNLGISATTEPIELVDTLPAGVTFVSAAGPGWVTTASGQVVTGVFADSLGPGGTTSLEIAVLLADGVAGDLCNVATVATVGDADESNNRAEACVTLPGAEAIDLDKHAYRPDVLIGGSVEYRLTIAATGAVPLEEVFVLDRLPPGFVYEAGSARVDGRSVPDPVSGTGRTLEFEVGRLVPPDTAVLTYVARAGPAAPVGEALNRAIASYRGGSSNEARARVLVRAGAFTDEGMIVGTVFADSSGAVRAGGTGECACLPSDRAQRGERGIPGVRVLLQDGTSALTDSEGRYLFPALSPRTWVVKVDRSTVPAGVGLVRLTNRHAADGGSVLVDLKKGELHRADFGVAWTGPGVDQEIERRRMYLDSAAVDPVRSATGLEPAGGPTGLAPGIPWTRYRPLMPEAWTGRLLPDRGPLAGVVGFPRSIADTTVADGSGRGLSATVSPSTRTSDSTASAGDLAIGLIEARLDFRSRTDSELGGMGRDAFEDALLSVSFDEDEGRVHGGARAALFYRGRAADRYDVTVRLDTEEDERAVLFRDITPDDFYPIVGDASIKGFGARSRSRVFGRIAAGDSYLTWGDFNTGRAPAGLAGTRSLGEYARTLNGALQHYESDRVAIDAFASRDRSVQVVDVLRAEGVSGPYGLSRTDGLVNSERVELVTRDRDQPAVVLRTEVLERFTDYTVEPLAGRLLFRRPVPAFDDDLNPVEIRVTYEVEGDTDRFWVWGANGRFQPLSGLEIGGSLVRDENPLARLDLESLNATLALPASTWLTGEYARTGGSGPDGDATRVELVHASERVRLRGFLVTTDSTFRNPTSGYRAGRDELGLLGAARLAEGTHAFTELLSSEDARTGTTRRGARVGIRQALSARLSGEVGFRWASTDAAGAASPGRDDTKAVGLRLQAVLAGSPEDRRGTAFVEFEQDVAESDRRRAALGADYRVLDGVRLYARHELMNSLTGPWNLDAAVERNATVLGVATENRSGQALFSEYRVRDAIDGREAQAAIGLRNAWRIGRGVRLAATLERLTPIGPGSTDATAVTGAAEYTGSPVWKGSLRTEYQARDGADNLFGSIGYARRLSPAFSLLGNAVFSTRLDGSQAWSRGRLGMAYRQVGTNRWNGLARYEHRYDRSTDAAGGARSSTGTHILAAHLDFQPVAGTTLRGQWTSRFTSERRADVETSGTAHLAGGRATVDLGARFDAGVIGRSLFAGGTGGTRFGLGGEIGVRLPADLRLAAGYNVFGFRDDAAASGEYTDRGAYVQLAFRFDEGLWSDRDTTGTGRAGEACHCPGPPVGPRVPPTDPDSVDLDIVIMAPTRVPAGEAFDVEIIARNAVAPGGTADSVALTAVLSGASFVPSGENELRADSTLSWPSQAGVPMRPGLERSHWALIIADRAMAGDSIILDATVASRPNESDTTNNHGRTVIHVMPGPHPECTDPDIVPCAPDLFVWIKGPHKVGSQDSIRYEFWTRNIGNATAVDVVSRASFPDLWALSQDSDDRFARKDTTVLISPSLGPKRGVSWGITLPPAGLPVKLVAETNSRTITQETNLQNNDDVRVTLVPCDSTACVGLRIDGPVSATMGDTVRYTVSTDNLAGVALNDVLVSGGTEPTVRVASMTGGVADDLGWPIPVIGAGRTDERIVQLLCSASEFTIDFLATSELGTRTAEHRTECLRSDLRVSVAAMGPVRGASVTFGIVVANDGPAPARKVEIRATGPADVVFDRTATSPGGVFSGRNVDWQALGSLAVGDSVELRLVMITRPGQTDARVDVTTITSTPESRSDNNSDFARVRFPSPVPRVIPPTVGPPLPPPGIAGDPPMVSPARRDPASLEVDIDTIAVDGHTVHYSITTRNTAPTPALDVLVMATWPERVGFIHASRGEPVGDSLVTTPVDFGPLASRVDTLVLLMPRAPDSAMIRAFATALAIPRVEGPSPIANNRDSTVALMVIQRVVIPDTVIIPDGRWGPVYRWLLLLLPWLLILLVIVLIILIIRWWFWPPPRRVPPEKDSPPPVPAQGPFFLPPIPGVPGLHRACGPIEVEGVRGTAYLVRPDRLVTCSHVVLNRQRGDRVTILLDGRPVSATVHAVDPHTDVAILRPAEPIRGVKPLELAPEGPAPAWWRGYGFPGGPAEPGAEFGGTLMQPSARDRFRFGTMTVTGPGLADTFGDPASGLGGSPVLVDGRVIGHLRGPIIHPDTLTRSFAGLLKAAPASRIIEMLREEPASDARRSDSRVESEPQEWSIAPELSSCEAGAHHATLVYRAADAAFANRVAVRLEGCGFDVRLHQRETGPVPGSVVEGARRVFLLHSRAWQASGTDGTTGPLLNDGVEPVVVRVDDAPIPEFLKRFDSIDFCGHEPDRGLPFGSLLKLLAGQLDPSSEALVDTLVETTESVIALVKSARGRPRRTRFAVKRWRDAGLPGHTPDLLGAEQLIEVGRAEEALEILEDVPAGARSSQLTARALAAVGRIDEAITKLESLRSAGHSDAGTSAPLARLHWQKWIAGGRRAEARIRRAFDIASELYGSTRDPRAGMDAARYAVAAGERDEASILANGVRDDVSRTTGYEGGGWDLLGEAGLLLGDDDAALDALTRAVAAAPDDEESVIALYGRVREIVEHIEADAKRIATIRSRLEAIFYLPRVATIDVSDDEVRGTTERDLRADLRARLDEYDVGVGVCCPDSVPALVFAEEVLKRGGRVRAILPLPRDQFVARRILTSASGRVEAVLDHERTTTSPVPEDDAAGPAASPVAGAGTAPDDSALRDALADAAGREADRRAQRSIVFQGTADAGTEPPDFLLDPGERGPERVVLESLRRGGQALQPEADDQTTSDAGRTRDLMRVRPATRDRNEPFRYRRLHCVVIGIDEYTQWNPLLNAVNDAKGIARTLETGFGFTTRRLINAEATADRIREMVLETVAEELHKDDLLVLFFAGHGHTERDENDEERGFLVPVDAWENGKKDLDDLIPMEEVVSWPDQLACEDVLWIFDSCFSGFAAFAGGVTRRGESDDARIAISAGSAEQPVLDGGAPGGFEDHSVFTAHLLLRLTDAMKAAEEGDEQVDSMRLYVDLRDRVARATGRRQTPAYGFMSGHGAGEIWFIPRKPPGQ